MLEDINKKYVKVIRDRVGEIGDNIIIENEEYRECQNRLDYLFSEVKKNLGKEHKHLLYNFEEVVNEQLGIIEELIYRQAIKDFIAFKRELVS